MTEPARRAFPVRVAAIDAGSNAIRFVVADFAAPDSCTVATREASMARAVAAFRLFP